MHIAIVVHFKLMAEWGVLWRYRYGTAARESGHNTSMHSIVHEARTGRPCTTQPGEIVLGIGAEMGTALVRLCQAEAKRVALVVPRVESRVAPSDLVRPYTCAAAGVARTC